MTQPSKPRLPRRSHMGWNDVVTVLNGDQSIRDEIIAGLVGQNIDNASDRVFSDLNKDWKWEQFVRVWIVNQNWSGSELQETFDMATSHSKPGKHVVVLHESVSETFPQMANPDLYVCGSLSEAIGILSGLMRRKVFIG